jgi:hypothetical protein
MIFRGATNLEVIMYNVKCIMKNVNGDMLAHSHSILNRLPGSDQILAELTQNETLQSEFIKSLILFGLKKNLLISGRSLLP